MSLIHLHVRTLVLVGVATAAAGSSFAQHPWQRKPVRDPAQVAQIVGEVVEAEPSRDLNIIWVWGVDKNHGRGFHEYGWVMDRYVNTLLPQVPRVHAEAAMYFPSEEQWEKADLVVFYYQQRRPWGKREYELVDSFQNRGGGLIFLHLAILEGDGDQLAERIGLSYGTRDKGNGLTQWGALPTPIQLTAVGKESPLLSGFPSDVDLVDEHYWNLNGRPEKVATLMTAPGGPVNASNRAPRPDELDGQQWPVIWTAESGNGRVFATVLGHNYFTFNDPYFRIILLRAIAWTMDESSDPFLPLVMSHLER